jgi:Uncharacterised protein family (UPF0227)
MRRFAAGFCDSCACLLLNSVQRGWPIPACSAKEFDDYLTRNAVLTREEFYRVTPLAAQRWVAPLLRWESPLVSGFSRNDTACARIFYSPAGRNSPTLIFLHALMSASDIGYVRLARRWQSLGWNAVVLHLPFHFSRTPAGFPSGALALSAHLPRNGETLRQAVVEVRQIMQLFREYACTRFALVGTSYGGWIAALVSFLEPQIEFLGLLQPVTDLEQAIWLSPASRGIRWRLRQAEIAAGATLRHAHLSSPLAGQPLCRRDRILLIGGKHDKIVPPDHLRRLQTAWEMPRMVEVNQGHFGYEAMRIAMSELERASRE